MPLEGPGEVAVRELPVGGDFRDAEPAGRGGESDEGDAHMEPRTPSVHASAHTHPNSLTRHPPPRPAALRRSHRSRPEWHLSRGGSSDPGGHVPLGVAGAEAAQRQDLVDGLEVGVGEGEVGGAGVLLDALRAAGAGDRHDVLAPGQEPGQGQLGDGGVLGRRELGELVDGFEILLEVARLPARVDVAHVGGFVLAGGLGGAGDEPAAEGE